MDKHKQVFLRYLNILSILIALFLWSVFFFHFFRDFTVDLNTKFMPSYPSMFSFPLFFIFSIIILWRTTPNRGVYMFALYLSMISQNVALQMIEDYNSNWFISSDIIYFFSNALTGTLFIKALQNYPRELEVSDIKQIFSRNIFFKNFLIVSIKKYSWIVIFVFLFSIDLIRVYTGIRFFSTIMDILILITGSLSIVANYKRATDTEKKRIVWILWGVLSFTILMMLNAIIYLFSNNLSTNIRLFFSSLQMLVATGAILMSLLFFNAFNTGVLIRRTIVDGLFFILIVLMYNTIEHYLLHWISHQLHLSDVLISSLLSGFFVLLFSPLHHKLMHFLEKNVKKNKA